MPRNGSGVASPVAGTDNVVPNTTIESSVHNALVADIYSLFNTAWPVSLGGTGLTVAAPFPTVTVDNTVPRWDGTAGKFQTSGVTIDDNNFLGLTYSEDGAAIGPTIDLYRLSASPAVSDIIGSIDFNGRDSAGNKQLYARIGVTVTDPTSTSEDATLAFSSVVAGTLRSLSFATGAGNRVVTVNGDATLNDWFDQSVKAAASPSFAGLTVTGGFASISGSGGFGSVPATEGRFINTATNGLLLTGVGSTYDFAVAHKNGNISIGVPTGTTNFRVLGQAQIADGSVGTPSIGFTSDTNTGFYYDGAGPSIAMSLNGTRQGNWGASGLAIGSYGTGLIDMTATEYGASLSYDGLGQFARLGAVALNIKRSNDGVVQNIYRITAVVGTIAVSAGATAYNTSSDEQLKRFIGVYDPAEAIRVIRADPVRDFIWSEEYGGSYAIGWGAQTSYGVSKDLATPGHGKPGDDDYQPWGVDQGKRTPYLWAAVTNILDRLEALENA